MTPVSLWKNHHLESNLGWWHFQCPTSKALDVKLPLKLHICFEGGVVHAQHRRGHLSGLWILSNSPKRVGIRRPYSFIGYRSLDQNALLPKLWMWYAPTWPRPLVKQPWEGTLFSPFTSLAISSDSIFSRHGKYLPNSDLTQCFH